MLRLPVSTYSFNLLSLSGLYFLIKTNPFEEQAFYSFVLSAIVILNPEIKASVLGLISVYFQIV